MRPPRPRPRSEPFRHAADYQPPDDYVPQFEEETVEVEPEPFTLRSEHVPTMKGLSDQIANLGQHLGGEMAELRHDIGGVKASVDTLRVYVMSDHAPRITAVEKKTGTIAPIAVGVGKWTAYVTLGLTIATQVASAFQPKLVGPLQTIIQMFQGASQ
jgi:hypothetical protein